MIAKVEKLYLDIEVEPNGLYQLGTNPDIDDKPLQFRISLSVPSAIKRYGERRAVDMEAGGATRITPALDEFSTKYAGHTAQDDAIAREFSGDGSFKLQMKDAAAAYAVLGELEGLKFGFSRWVEDEVHVRTKAEIMHDVAIICHDPHAAIARNPHASRLRDIVTAMRKKGEQLRDR